ncbi:MAG TPA: hypothetical protein VK426_08275, partial [Methanobacterium sp.]|nr:hypothetical protein [Methanobacterium sp.]
MDKTGVQSRLKGELSVLGTGFDFQGVVSLMGELEDLRSRGYFNDLFYVFNNWERPINISTGANKKLQSINPLLTQLISINLTPEDGSVFSGSIDYYSFYNFYLFLEWVYAMDLKRNLHEEDIEAIFSSNIMEKIIFNLEKFNSYQPKICIIDQFLLEMTEAKWRNAEEFFDKLHDLLFSKVFDEFGEKEISFKRELKRVVKLLTVFNAIKNRKIHITTSDVISGYKLLFKIIRTDIAPYTNKKAYKGILVCYNCYNYHYLQENEAPDDFTYCSCENPLTYVKSIDDIELPRETVKELIMDEKGLIAGAITSLVLALIFNNIALMALFCGFATVFMAKNYT